MPPQDHKLNFQLCKTPNLIFLHIYFRECFEKSKCKKQWVKGSIPDEVIGFFNWPNPSSRTMALW
jgi:hypothetical protein